MQSHFAVATGGVVIGSKPRENQSPGGVEMVQYLAKSVSSLCPYSIPVMPRTGSITSKMKLSKYRGNRLHSISLFSYRDLEHRFKKHTTFFVQSIFSAQQLIQMRTGEDLVLSWQQHWLDNAYEFAGISYTRI